MGHRPMINVIPIRDSMPKQVEVLVEDISTDDQGRPTELAGTRRIITYKSYLFTQDKFKIIGEVDASGNLVPGNPNLSAQHRPITQPPSVAAHVVDAGLTTREQELLAEIARLKADKSVQETGTSFEPVQERKKPGPKPKKEVQEVVA